MAACLTADAVKAETFDYDGTYDCLICGESVRGKPALACKVCLASPACVSLLEARTLAEWQAVRSRYASTSMRSTSRASQEVLSPIRAASASKRHSVRACASG